MNSALVTLPADQEVLGRYSIKHEIARTGMSVLYRAVDRSLDMDVCLKYPHRVVGGRPPDVKMLKKEFTATAKLNHDNIVKSYKFEYDEGQPFFVMEFLEGQTFEEVIPKGEGIESYEDIYRYCRQIKDALVAAHGKKVVHRDLKPSNIMLEDSGNVKVLDFGIARLVKETFTRITAKAHPDGTMLYMAPEQLRGKEKLVGPASDWYSFGVLLYEMITGEPPFSVGDITYQHLNEEPQRVDEIREDCPPALASLVAGMLQKDCEKRSDCIPTLIETIDALAEGRSADATGLEEAITTAPARRRSRRSSVVTISLGTAAVALATLSGLLGLGLTQARDEQKRLETEQQQMIAVAREHGIDLENLEQTRVQLVDANEQKAQEISGQKQVIADKSEKISTQTGQIRGLNGTLDTTRRRLGKTEDELAMRTGELDDLRAEYRALQGVKQSLDRKVAGLEGNVDRMGDHISELNGQVQSMVSQNEKLRGNIRSWEQQVDKLESENVRLARGLDNSQNEVRELRSANANGAREYDRLAATYEQLRLNYNSLINDYNYLRRVCR